jgi:2-polyprenyl-6-methoxyphenol hydroxylase-like FAD-dependent oxidoreductase
MLQYLAQGGCQALEDADALSTSLALHSDPALAFKHYESIRAPRSGQVQRWARLMGDIVHADGVLADLRDELLRHRAAADLEQVDWLYSNSSATGQDS